MIAELDLGRLQQAKVWVGECPVRQLNFDGIVRRTFEVAGRAGEEGRITIEVKMPRGPIVMYGLLGAHFAPQPGETALAVAVGCTGVAATDRPVFMSGLVGKPEIAREGLPREFADGVLAGVDDALAAGHAPGPGVLFFDCSASGDVGSSPAAYRILAHAVTALLAEHASTEEKIRSALEGLF